jgi:hypothetical protein
MATSGHAGGGAPVDLLDATSATSARSRLRDPVRVVTLLRAVRDPLGDEPTAGVAHDAWDGGQPDAHAGQGGT